MVQFKERCELIKTLIFMVTAICLSSCKKQDEELIQDNFSNIMQTVMSESGAQSSATEGATSPLVGCSFANVRSGCTSNLRTIAWNSCTIGTITMTGGWTETFSSATACSNFTNAGGLATNGDTVTRTTLSSKATFLSSATLTTDTSGGVAWDGTTINANGVTITQGSGSSRTVNFDGIHRVLKGPLGTKWFDHYVTGSVTISGKRSSGNRALTAGTITVYHNLLKYTATNTVAGVTWGSSSCCYPTAGVISTTLTGSVTGTAALDFSQGATTCGNATYTNTGGTQSTVVLTHCP